MGKIITPNQPCKLCTSSDAAQVYDDGYTFCFSCRKSYPTDSTDIPVSTARQTRSDIRVAPSPAEITSKLNSRGWADRKITKYVSEFFGVKSDVDINTDQIFSRYYPYVDESTGEISGYKIRFLPKNFMVTGITEGLFALHLFKNGGKRIIITEGEEDALAVATASYNKYKKIYPVVSLKSAIDLKSVIKSRDTLLKYQEVVIWCDNDEPGRRAAQAIAKIVGYNRAKIVESKEKDACEVLIQPGGENKILSYIFDAKQYSPAGIISGEETWEKYKEFKSLTYIPWPKFLSSLNELTYGRALGTITMIAAGCHAKGTEVLMHDGGIKKVEDIVVGDKLAGDDRSSREVLSLARGRQQMYRIDCINGTSFEVNEDHILSLKYCREQVKYKNVFPGDIINVSVKEYLTWNKTKKKFLKQYYGPGVEGVDLDLPIDPWLLGVWLGDGTASCGKITNIDKEIWEGIEVVAKKEGWTLGLPQNKITRNINGGFQLLLRANNLLNNKHIPSNYFKASRHQRLQLLAGLIDTDGHLEARGCYVELSQSRKELLDQIVRLARGLGYKTIIKDKYSKQWKRYYYRINICGDLSAIPVKVKRKKSNRNLDDLSKDFRNTGFTVTPTSVEDYYGFELSGNHLYQLANGIVTHNTSTGKSSLLREDIVHLIDSTEAKIGGCFLEEDIGETVSGLLSVRLSKRLGLPSTTVSEEEEYEAWKSVLGTERIKLVDHQGSISDDSLIDKIEYLAIIGCQFIYLDHITIAVSEAGADVNSAIDKFMSDALRLVKKYNIWLGIISHVRKTSSQESVSAEEGGMINEDSLKGSASLKQISFQTIALVRNKYAENPKTRNTTRIFLLKDRKSGNTGPAGSYTYDPVTGRMKDNKGNEEEEFTITDEELISLG